MKKVYFYITAIYMLLISAATVQAQVASTVDGIRVEQVTAVKDGGSVRIDMNLNLDNLRMPSSNMLILTPQLRSADGVYNQKFQPVVIMGASRNRTIQRAIDFEGYRFEETPQVMMRRHNGKQESIPLTLVARYEDWLRGGELVFTETKTACAYKEVRETEYRVMDPVLPVLIDPVYEYAYVIPPVEEIKQRSETYSAHLDFQVGKYVILRDFKENADVLQKVDKAVNELRGDENLTVTDFHITGYASPEGNEQSNMKLSENRAKAFVTYLTERYNIPASTVKTDWKGEDWEGLRKEVQESGIANKNEILNVLDEPNVATRKTKLQQLDGGKTYRMLLDTYYPHLRRIDYTISFVAKKFSVEEAKEQIRVKPQYLSLNEMFLVANTYPKDSREFKEVFDTAVRMYPESQVAQLNAGTLELENGAVDSAIERLLKVNMPEAWNNLGIAYALKGDYGQAQRYFDRAAQAGDRTATRNASELQRYLDAK